MALTRQTNGSNPLNIMQASWWNDFMDLLTGVMTDQAVNISNTIAVNGISTAYGPQPTGGYSIEDSLGTPHQFAYMLPADNDFHLVASSVTHKLKITKDTGAYDIAVFDMSGASGVTTINGALTMTGACTAGSYSCSGTSYSGGAHTVNSDINLTGNINFTGGNNGSVKNPTGGVLNLNAGGSAAVQFNTNAGGTACGYVDLNGFHLNRGQYNLLTNSLGYIVMAKTGTGSSANINHNLNTTPSCAMVCITGSGGSGSATIYGVNSTQFSITCSSGTIPWTALFMA